MILRKKGINFLKMHSIANDYVYIDEFLEKNLLNIDRKKLAQEISRYHYGVGSDGLIFLNRGIKTHYRMEMYNADGSYSPMCGNGLRTLARYIHDFKEKNSLKIEIESAEEVYDLYIKDNNGKLVVLKIKNPKFESFPPVLNSFELKNGQILKYLRLSLGNPHCVIVLDPFFDLEKMDLFLYVDELEKKFLEKLNYEFIQIKNPKHFYQRTWERGSGETLSCGSGAAAAFISSYYLRFLEKNDVLCTLKGGTLIHSFDEKENAIFQEGLTEYVFKGVYYYI